jgi:hypothetical protein
MASKLELIPSTMQASVTRPVIAFMLVLHWLFLLPWILYSLLLEGRTRIDLLRSMSVSLPVYFVVQNSGSEAGSGPKLRSLPRLTRSPRLTASACFWINC